MEPLLHKTYTVNEAIAAFGDVCSPEFLCDGQFIVLPKAVLCMATVGDPKWKPNVCSPSCFQWKPRRRNYSVLEEIEKPWLPAKVSEVWGTDRKKLKEHHVFIRLPSDEGFFYAGKAHLGSYGDSGKGGKEADFLLNEKLPHDMWLRFGGYPGWLVEVNHKTHCVDNRDTSAFPKLVKQIPRKKFSHLYMTRYEEDSLTIHTNASRGWLMYLRHPDDGGIYIRDLEDSGNPEAEEEFRCVCGISLEFPRSQTVPRELAIQAATEFFSTGRLPSCVHWE